MPERSEIQTYAYQISQKAIADLKSAIHILLSTEGKNGLTNSQIGRALGIYTGHVGHEGHISRTLLGIMEAEGVVLQNKETKKWFLKEISSLNGGNQELA
jgi:hypothetical protein